MRITVSAPDDATRLSFDVTDGETPWAVRAPGEEGEALLDPAGPSFLAEGYPGWLHDLCEAIDADRVLAQRIVAEVHRRR